jgi:hypothetical protein
LVVKRNPGSYNLISDILDKDVKYIIIDSIIYIVHYDKEICEKLRLSTQNKTNVDISTFNNEEILILFQLNFSFNFANVVDTNNCNKLSPIVFFNNKLKPINSNVYGSYNTSDTPVLVLAFNT